MLKLLLNRRKNGLLRFLIVKLKLIFQVLENSELLKVYGLQTRNGLKIIDHFIYFIFLFCDKEGKSKSRNTFKSSRRKTQEKAHGKNELSDSTFS